MEKAVPTVYSTSQEKAISDEFQRLKGQHYLDHAGATLYSEKQILAIMQDLTTQTYGNPHATNTTSKLSEDTVDQIRFRILQHFNADPKEYDVVFTSGATSALKMVAETFCFETNNGTGKFVYLQDNHTSVVSMREYAKKSECLLHKNAIQIFSSFVSKTQRNVQSCPNALFAYPAQSNFSGSKYPLDWIHAVKKGALDEPNKINHNWYVMLDAASYVSTNPLDLSKYKPDFVCMSFYKIFGYPTGLGALLIKLSSSKVLKKRYFGGGTLLLACSLKQINVPRNVLHEAFEDGTIDFLSIASIKHGFDTLKRLSLSMETISTHTFFLARYVYRSLSNMRHGNGEPVVVLYHDTKFDDIDKQGGVVTFNLTRPCGSYVGYAEVMHVANLFNISVRTGCFCNPGACRRHLNLNPIDVRRHFDLGHVCGDNRDLVDGYPTGCVRISFGYMTTRTDCDAFLDMIEECFMVKVANDEMKQVLKIPKTQENKKDFGCTNGITNGHDKSVVHVGVLEKIMIYPVKSCGAFEVEHIWELTTTGLKFDRLWMIVDEKGVGLTQKRDSRLCLIRPRIDECSGCLNFYYQDEYGVSVSLQQKNDIRTGRTIDSKCQSKVCTDLVQGYDCGDEISEWLSRVLETPGLRLLRLLDESGRTSRSSRKPQLSLTNEAQFLMINSSSVRWLLDKVLLNNSDFEDDLTNAISRFRPNFVVKFDAPFVENDWKQIRIDSALFKCERLCTRCQMICIDQFTGKKTVEPLKTLSREFNGSIKFGVYLSHSLPKHSYLQVKSVIEGKVICD